MGGEGGVALNFSAHTQTITHTDRQTDRQTHRHTHTHTRTQTRTSTLAPHTHHLRGDKDIRYLGIQYDEHFTSMMMQISLHTYIT